MDISGYRLIKACRLSTTAALGLDIYVRSQQTSRGVYRLHDIDVKHHIDAVRGPFTDDGQAYGSGGLAGPRESEAWEEPRPSIGPYNEQADKILVDQGYSHPEENLRYQDTEYRGAGA